ncbi:MAG: hypothetical protein HC837_01855 [Chloroflexaceae bacterium]|nr:hypothetical protein [Chloroflexaceae bacterium]
MPISPLQEETIDGQTLQVQWFERARFEQHPELEPPFQVLLGLLGREQLMSSDSLHTPVIFIPGVGGTFLFRGDEDTQETLVWLDPIKALDPRDPDDLFLDPLCLYDDGQPCNPGETIRAASVIGWFDLGAENSWEQRLIEETIGSYSNAGWDVYGSFIAFCKNRAMSRTAICSCLPTTGAVTLTGSVPLKPTSTPWQH